MRTTAFWLAYCQFYSHSHQSEKTDAVTVVCVQYIDVSDECLSVCWGGSESDQCLRIFLPCTAQQNILKTSVILLMATKL